MSGNTVRFQATIDDKVSSSLSRIRDNFDLMGKGAASASLAGNLGAKAISVGIGLVTQAAEHAVGFLGDVVKAGMAEEASIAKLSTSLKANVPAWDGNTTAIERTIRAQTNLGFSDAEQRDSLALLLAATHDSSKALEVQRTAMDLARFKNISLADATEALTRVEAGSYRILKSLGIELKAGATQTEALAAVQKVAAGQADDYAKTLEGKLLVAQVRVGLAMENLGKKALPVLADALSNVLFIFDKASVSWEELQQRFAQGDGGAARTMERLGEASDATSISAQNLWQILRDSGLDIDTMSIHDFNTAVADWQDQTERSSRSIKSSFGATEKAALSMGVGVAQAAQNALFWTGKFKDNAIADINQLIGQAYDPLILMERMWADSRALNAAELIRSSAKATAAQRTDARNLADTLTKTVLEEKVQLLQMGELGAVETQRLIDGLRASVAAATGPTKGYLDEILSKILAIEAAGKVIPINFKITQGWMGHAPGKGPLQYDDGGVVPGALGSAQLAIVHGGEEVLTYADRMSGGGSGGGSGGLTVNFNSTWPPTQAQAQEVAALIDRNLYYRRKSNPH